MNVTMILGLTPPLCEREFERYQTEFFKFFFQNPEWLTEVETTISEFLEKVVNEAEFREVYNLELSDCRKMFTWVEGALEACKHRRHVAYVHEGKVYTWRS